MIKIVWNFDVSIPKLSGTKLAHIFESSDICEFTGLSIQTKSGLRGTLQRERGGGYCGARQAFELHTV